MSVEAEEEIAALGSAESGPPELDTAQPSDAARTACLDALLQMVAAAPISLGPERVISHALETGCRLLPAAAVGACVVHPMRDGRIVDVRLPRGIAEAMHHGNQLFPQMDFEHVLPLPGFAGSTVHIGTQDEPLSARSHREFVSSRLGLALGAVLRAAFELEAAGAAPNRDPWRLKDHLVQTEKLATLGQIVAGVVHELANPLTSIVAYADYLSKKGRSHGAESEDLERLERIEQAAERILKFSRDLVSYARPASEASGPVAIHQVIEQAAVFCEHEFSSNHVEFVRQYSAGVEAVQGKAGPLTQVFVNLFTNASHAMRNNGGRLVVSTAMADGRVCIRIADTGTGIPREVLARIFDPFFTTKDQGQGTGLGLFIVSDIVNAHDGTLEATSVAGEGTTFTITFPTGEAKSVRRWRKPARRRPGSNS